MNRPTGPLACTRRVALLLGALLHLAGVAALPALHAWGSGLDVAAAGQDGLARLPAGQPDGLPAHDELHCVVCHAHGSVALPVDGPRIALTHAEHPERLPDAPALSSSLYEGATRARAPPLA
jgi:hypothetical protein